MEYDITHAIARLVRETDANIDRHLEEQSQAVSKLTCVNPFYGRWADLGVELFFSIFELEDRDFSARFPDLVHLTKQARERFLARMKEHLHCCQSCARKYEIQNDLDARIERACCENSAELLQQLRPPFELVEIIEP
jgi:hypothetical protein